MKTITSFLVISFVLINAWNANAQEPSSAKPKSLTVKRKAVPVRKKAVKKIVPAQQIQKATASPESAKPARRDSVLYWLKDLRKKVAKSNVRQNQIVAVAAVRGNETPDSPPLYWKGQKSDAPAASPEAQELQEALDVAINGDEESSKTKLQAFIEKHPDSILKTDAEQALEKLAAAPVLEE